MYTYICRYTCRWVGESDYMDEECADYRESNQIPTWCPSHDPCVHMLCLHPPLPLTLSTHQQELLHITVCSVQAISLACACNKLHEISGERVHVCPEKHFFLNSHICTHTSNYFLGISFVYKRFRTHQITRCVFCLGRFIATAVSRI